MDRRFESILVELREKVSALEEGRYAADGVSAIAHSLCELERCHSDLVVRNEALSITRRELLAARDRYRELFDDAPNPVLVLSEDGVVLEANRAAEALLVRRDGPLVGHPFTTRLDQGEAARFLRHVRAVRDEATQQALALKVTSPDDAVRWWLLHTAPLANGPPAALLCNLADVTEEREACDARLEVERRSRELEKVEAVGRVAATIAHEVNNLLASVISLGEHARESLDEGSAIAPDLDAIVDGAWRGARLMRGLQGLSRVPGAEARSFDAIRAISTVSTMLRHKNARVKVVLDVPAEPIWIRGSEDELVRALLNVGKNGIEAMTHGELRLSAARLTTQGGVETLRIRCVDQGVGMSREACALAFAPLYSTKAASGGSGLGLAIVQRTVTSHGGSIFIESEIGVGTIVTIALPIAVGIVAEGEGKSTAPHPVGNGLAGLCVAIVDDDEGTRAATRRQIEAMGGHVVHDSSDARWTTGAIRRGLRLDVAIVALEMPALSGPELLFRLEESFGRTLPVVLVTGGASDIVSEGVRGTGRVALVRKPWTRDELLAAIRCVMAAAERSLLSPTSPA